MDVWRRRVLERFLQIAFFGGIIAATVDIASYGVIGNVADNMVVIVLEVFAIICTAVIVFVRRLPYHMRAGVPLTLLYLIGLESLFFAGGIDSDGRFFFLLCILFGTVLFNGKIGSLLFGVTIASMAARLLLSGLGPNDTSFAAAITDVVIFAFICAVIVFPLAYLIFGLATSSGEASAQSRQAEHARALAERHSSDLQASNAALEQTRQHLRDLVATLETPTVTVADGVLLAPIIGALDSNRLGRLKKHLLHTVYTQRARLVVIDLTGVGSVDSAVVQGIVQTAQTIRVLGCQVVLTGISSEVAATLTVQGINLGGVQTAATPQDVLGADVAAG